MNKWIVIGISALSDFVITAGGAMMAIDTASTPTRWQLIICAVAGLVQAARGVQKTLTPPPP